MAQSWRTRTWTADRIYVLAPDARVLIEAPATLTVEPGTQIWGQRNSALIVSRGARIIAAGSQQRPILFTSAKPVGMRARGDWRGLVILGKAPVNTNRLAPPPSDEAVFEPYAPSGADGRFGGTDRDDSSGILRYVRIEFGGNAYLGEQVWSNLNLCGVGAGTTIDFVQSHAAAGDGVALFGGTVNVKHLVISQNEDDGFDTDNGYQGKGQFIVIQHISPRGTDASNGYESDNHGTAASYTAGPRTVPTLYNVTLIGKKDYTAASFGMLFRRGTGGKYFNHIAVNWASGVSEIRDVATADQKTAGNLFVKNSIFFNSAADGMNWPPAMAMNDIPDEKGTFLAADWMNREVDPMLTDALNLTAPNFAPKAGSPALTGGASPPADGFFDTAATFMGALGTEDWTAGWTAYPSPKVP